MKHLLRTSLFTPVGYLLATAPSAFGAVNKAPKGYAGVHANVQGAVASAGATASNASGSGNLPLMVVGVVVLVLVGAALRRFSGNHA
jgi:hypothetical protein